MTIHLTFWPVWWFLLVCYVVLGGRKRDAHLGHAFLWVGGLLLFAGVAIGRLVS